MQHSHNIPYLWIQIKISIVMLRFAFHFRRYGTFTLHPDESSPLARSQYSPDPILVLISQLHIQIDPTEEGYTIPLEFKNVQNSQGR